MKNTIIALAASAIALGSANAQNLFLNGDFEMTDASGAADLSAFNIGAPAGNAAPTVFFSNSVVPASSGIGALDLGPSGLATGNGGFAEQAITVAATDTYTFSFDFTAESSGPVGPIVDLFLLDVTGGAVLSQSFTAERDVYQTFTQNFSLTAGSTVNFRFTDTSPTGINGVIDNVSFAAVPEPSSALLLGLGAFGLLGRRKR